MGIFRKTLSIILCFVLISGIDVFAVDRTEPYDGGIISDSKITVNMYDKDDEKNKGALELFEGDTAGTQFFATTNFASVEVQCPSYSNNIGNLTLTLYKWDETYEKTVAGEPLAQNIFKNFADNAWLKISSNTAFPAGEYYWELSDSTEKVGVWYSLNEIVNLKTYNDGMPFKGSFYSRLTYTRTPKIDFQPLSDPPPYSPVTPPPQNTPDVNNPVNTLDPFADTWVATDGLGRTLPVKKDVGGPKEKFVGMFYWIWNAGTAKSFVPRNITEILSGTPDAKNDYSNPVWAKTSDGTPYFWDEPLFGYYTATDKYVLRKHAEMLAAAGVDVILFDCTNGSDTFKVSYTALCQVFEEARAQGVKTPQIAFVLNLGSTATTITAIKSVYNDIYKQGKYQDLWFYWKGKPLIMAYYDVLNVDDPYENEIINFFTFRPGQPVYQYKPGGVSTDDKWGWLSIYPQDKYGVKDGKIEEMCVGAAQNWGTLPGGSQGLTAMNGKNVFGRSYSGILGHSATTDDAVLKGINFQEQWDYAIQNDPEFIFVTGWNEWTAGRYKTWGEVDNAFPDEFNDEFSRDVEPTKGQLQDNYYYQLVSNIRRYKGVRATPVSNGAKTISITGNLSQWDKIQPEFRSWEGSIPDRDSDGWVGTHYENHTGRNDIITSKVSYDKDNIYLLVQTANDISPVTDPGWMRLFLDTSPSEDNNWEGYEYVINRLNPSDGKAILEASTGGWNFSEVAKLDYNVSGNSLQITIPRKDLNIPEGSFAFNFKWSDNMQNDGDIMDFYTNGEAAPLGRFMYRFETKGFSGNAVRPWVIIVSAAGGIIILAGVASLVYIKTRKKQKQKQI
ncbi:MAG: hypothetical protein LBI03_07950 [Clostridiales bacterium]|jgi:hypothetical protein|nr:hypothetical protein [Clostridiales bacterium]